MELETDRERGTRCLSLTEAIRAGLMLAITCKPCRRTRVIDPEPLWRMARVRRWPDTLIQLGRHLRCNVCGAKWPSVAATTDAPDDPRPIGPATSLDAARAATRLRC